MNIKITPEEIGGHLATCSCRELAQILSNMVSISNTMDIDPYAAGRACAKYRTKKASGLAAEFLTDFAAGWMSEVEGEVVKPVRAFVSAPLRGNDSEFRLATVTAGEHEGKKACILVQFSDGWCICEMSDGDLQTIPIDKLKLWKSVQKVGGKTED